MQNVEATQIYTWARAFDENAHFLVTESNSIAILKISFAFTRFAAVVLSISSLSSKNLCSGRNTMPKSEKPPSNTKVSYAIFDGTAGRIGVKKVGFSLLLAIVFVTSCFTFSWKNGRAPGKPMPKSWSWKHSRIKCWKSTP